MTIRRIIPCVIAVLLLAPAPQAKAQAADTVRGVVLDSLGGAPLVGAFITTDVDGTTTTTDSLGRFVVVASRRISRLQAFHDVPERLGLGALAIDRPLGASTWNPTLATPSMETVWSRLCEGRRPTDGLGGIIFGSTRLSDDTTRLAGVLVEGQWELPRLSSDSAPRYDSRSARSDSLGNYVLCGVRERVDAAIVGLSAVYKSSSLLLSDDELPIRRGDLVLGRIDAEATTAVVLGTVFDRDGKPVPDATVQIEGAEAMRSDVSGRFSSSTVPTGTRMMFVRKVGYLPLVTPLDVLDRGVRERTIIMDKGIALAAVTVTAVRVRSRDQREFQERQLAGFARIMEGTQIKKYPQLRSAIAMLPGIVVVGDVRGDFNILGRVATGGNTSSLSGSSRNPGGRCNVTLYLDGMLVGTDYLRVMDADEIAALELYPSEKYAPARYRTLGDDCAMLLVWTRAHLRK
ncbi:carboxypeptidase-like regulatory domain-containing protein [Gemmatimonas sp.]|uniref:carboxypeptidase-like regulatory domain-containing protein n=1 Tax=Gemmatimonas sp. TaxID=1962908 RepID=UPI003983D2A9